jgi:hypothetical protein
VLVGRLPAADRAGEIAVDQRGAAMMGLRVGSVLTMRAVPNDPSTGAAEPGQRPVRSRLLRERVVTRGSVLPVNELDKVPVILASPALFHRLGVQYLGAAGAYVKLRPGASPEAFGHRAQSLTRGFPAAGGGAFVADEGSQATAVQRTIRPEAVALALFALVLAVTALLIVGQAATRLLAASSTDTPVLAALGLTRWQLMAAGLIKVGVAAAIGDVVAAGVAIAASPLMPIPAPAITAAATERRLSHRPGITGWTFGRHGTVGIGGHVIPAIGLAAGKGLLLSPTLLQGRPALTSGEIVLGTSTLRQIGRHVGQTVMVTDIRFASGSWAARCSRTSARAASPQLISARGRRPPPPS